MKTVYFKKIDNMENSKEINNAIYEMLKLLTEEEKIKLEKNVPLKVHFGEEGNETFIKPEYFGGIKKYLEEKNIKTCYMDTNVLYKGSRTIEADHIQTALNHGFTDLEINIADGNMDHPYNEIEINLKHFDKCKIGDKYNDYNNFIVISHFKGHMLTGFGGAIKQLGMGFAARGGKLAMHSNSTPLINQSGCISCGSCASRCPVNAITLNPKATIDPNICIGCAACSVVCPIGVINNKWDRTDFPEKLAEYAYAAQLNKNNIYVNFVLNITKDCDCVGTKMELIAPHVGVFVSSDPVAIDSASLAKLQEISAENLFETGKKTLEYAESIGLGTSKYHLKEIN